MFLIVMEMVPGMSQIMNMAGNKVLKSDLVFLWFFFLKKKHQQQQQNKTLGR